MNHPPSTLDPVAALIRATAERVLARGAALFEALHAAVEASAPEGLVGDPSLAAEIERSNLAILAAWLESNVRRPGERVDPILSDETLDIVRDVERRGLEDSTYNYFRVGQGIAAQYVMEAAFEASDDTSLLQEALGIMLASSSDYIDRSVAALRTAILRERQRRAAGMRTRRLEVVSSILDGELGDEAVASARLGFELGRPLVACIVWSAPGGSSTVEELDAVVREISSHCGPGSPLVIAATSSSLWAWLPIAGRLDLAALRAQALSGPDVRVAMGSMGRGIAGFRRAHLDAEATQRAMHRVGPAARFATHDETRVVALAGADEPAAGAFVAAALGNLANAPVELRRTLLAVIDAGFETAEVAGEMGVHRNTVLHRVRRARALLPGDPVRWVEVGLALELDRWLPAPGTTLPRDDNP